MTGHHHFRLQIIVSGMLDEKNHKWLGSLTRNLTLTKAEQLMEGIDSLQSDSLKEYGDAVLYVAYRANEKFFSSLYMEGNDMMKGMECFRKYYNLDRVGDIVSVARKFNASDEYIVDEIMNRLSCDEDTAWNYLKKYESGVAMA